MKQCLFVLGALPLWVALASGCSVGTETSCRAALCAAGNGNQGVERGTVELRPVCFRPSDSVGRMLAWEYQLSAEFFARSGWQDTVRYPFAFDGYTRVYKSAGNWKSERVIEESEPYFTLTRNDWIKCEVKPKEDPRASLEAIWRIFVEGCKGGGWVKCKDLLSDTSASAVTLLCKFTLNLEPPDTGENDYVHGAVTIVLVAADGFQATEAVRQYGGPRCCILPQYNSQEAYLLAPNVSNRLLAEYSRLHELTKKDE